MIILAAIFSTLTIFVSILVHRRINYFKNIIFVPYETLNIFFGNAKKSTLGKWSVTYDIDRIYTKFKGSGLCAGFMQNFTPYLLPLNAEVLKEILITNFKNFQNNKFCFDTERHTITSLNPFWLRNEKWNIKRSELRPALTTSRLKAMFPLIDAASRELRCYITAKKLSETPTMSFDVREISLRYSCNSITSTTFALNAQAYDENTSDILANGAELCRRISLLPSSPITPEVNQYFIRLTNQAIHRRRYNNDKLNDLLNFVINLKDKRNFSDVETAAQAMTFFIGGFEKASLALCYVLYELSRNTKVQQKLRMEISQVICDTESSVPIDTLLSFQYLDQVFCEAIRLHPPLHYTTRVCNEMIELTMESNKTQKILIPKETAVWIPIHSVHRDPEYYENPNEFIPERFDVEQGGVEEFRKKCALIPFGSGQRNCLGQDLAVLQIKAAVVDILRHFKLVCCESVTQCDGKIKPKAFTNIPNGKLLVRFEDLKD